MIPYFEQPELQLGPLTIHAFGVLVAAAVLVGYRVFGRQLRERKLDPVLGDRLFSFIVVGGFVGAHLIDRLVYFPGKTLHDPWSLLKFWEGLSSFGGFVGAVVGAWLFTRRRHTPEPETQSPAPAAADGTISPAPTAPDRTRSAAPARQNTWPYLDAVAYAFPFGWILGRIGCFVAYDHPGSPTGFFLGQRYWDGVVRHNLGLEEALYTVLVAALFWVLGRRPRPSGFYLGLLPLVYAPFRFALDFMRLVDVRYFGLTPGQWGALALLALGAHLLRTALRHPAAADRT
jgi:phosphatidylglycerol:prolipoprotein diacylglycerol transferase